MQIHHIKTALKVAETGYINAASKALFMTAADGYHHIRLLEAELGFVLFERYQGMHKQMLPTEQGAKWLACARRAIELLDQGAVEMKLVKRVGKRSRN